MGKEGKIVKLIVLILSIVMVPALHAAEVKEGFADTSREEVLSKIYNVKRVIDGDTLELTNGEVVKLIGINAPGNIFKDRNLNIYKPSPEELQEAETWGVDFVSLPMMGQEATEFVKRWLKPGQEVRLEFDVQEKDKFGRLLAYVYACASWDMMGPGFDPDHYVDESDLGRGFCFSSSNLIMSNYKYFVNASIIKAGYTSPMIVRPNVKYVELFKELCQDARENKRGLWAKKEKAKNKKSFENLLNTSSGKTGEPKGLLKYIDHDGVKLDTSF